MKSCLTLALSIATVGVVPDIVQGTLPPPPPSNVVVDYSGEGNLVSWGASPGAVSYRIYRSEEFGFVPDIQNLLAEVVSPTTAWFDALGTWFHHYLVTAVDVDDDESDPASRAGPAPPANVVVDYSAGGNLVSWGPSPGAVSYRVYRSEEMEFGPELQNLATEVASPTTAWFDATGNWAHHYLVTAVDTSDNESVPATPSTVTSVDVPTSAALKIYGNVPNPFNPSTTIEFELPGAHEVTVEVFDLRGRLVRTLLRDEFRTPGRQTAVWNGLDETGREAASGIYFYRVSARTFAESRKMVLLR